MDSKKQRQMNNLHHNVRSEEEIFAERGHTRSRLEEMKEQLNANMNVFGNEDLMAKSGLLGGTPMVSRRGKQTIAEYLCFSNGIKEKEYVPTDPMDFINRPIEEIKERLKQELNVMDPGYSASRALLQTLGEVEGVLVDGNLYLPSGKKPLSRNAGGKFQTLQPGGAS